VSWCPGRGAGSALLRRRPRVELVFGVENKGGCQAEPGVQSARSLFAEPEPQSRDLGVLRGQNVGGRGVGGLAHGDGFSGGGAPGQLPEELQAEKMLCTLGLQAGHGGAEFSCLPLELCVGHGGAASSCGRRVDGCRGRGATGRTGRDRLSDIGLSPGAATPALGDARNHVPIPGGLFTAEVQGLLSQGQDIQAVSGTRR
jgi:hypothetical protein